MVEGPAKPDSAVEAAMPGRDIGALERGAGTSLDQSLGEKRPQDLDPEERHGHPLAPQGVDRPLGIADVKDAGQRRDGGLDADTRDGLPTARGMTRVPEVG